MPPTSRRSITVAAHRAGSSRRAVSQKKDAEKFSASLGAYDTNAGLEDELHRQLDLP